MKHKPACHNDQDEISQDHVPVAVDSSILLGVFKDITDNVSPLSFVTLQKIYIVNWNGTRTW